MSVIPAYKDKISIHALREEGDLACRSNAVVGVEISIHALREEGDGVRVGVRAICIQFQSTPSARRATRSISSDKIFLDISIHALREEGDAAPLRCAAGQRSISIHALREEGDAQRVRGTRSRMGISIHALREEGDPEPLRFRLCHQISIHALREEGDRAAAKWH